MAGSKSIEIGEKAPVFTLSDQNGEKVRLDDYKGRWVVLYFYPKDNTPGCTTEACEFTSHLKLFEKLDATVLGVSSDSIASHQKFIEKYKLKFSLLSDPDKKVLEKYGAYGIKKMYGKEVKGIIRSTFIIDPRGRIACKWHNVKAAGHAAKVHEKLTELQS